MNDSTLIIEKMWKNLLIHSNINIVVTYEIRIFFEGAKKEVFSSI